MKKRWFWVMGVVATAAGVGLWLNRPVTPPTVKTTMLTATQAEQTVSCTGVIEAADGVGVFVPLTCRIREVCVTAGQRVKKGDVLAVVDKQATYADIEDVPAQIALAAVEEEVTAPEDGIVVEVNARPGETLKLGTPCALLVRGSDMQVRVAIREKDLRVLKEGMPVRISGDGLTMVSYRGVLTEISSAVSVNGSAAVIEGVVVPEEGQPDGSFRLGISAKATVITSVIEKGYLVPYEAVLADEQGSYFYIAEGGVARQKRVAGAVQMPNGLLFSDEAMEGVAVILEPEKVSGDGAPVVEEVS